MKFILRAVGAAIALLAALFSGLAPALQGSKADVVSALKRKRQPATVYVLMSDAECNEGSLWEGVMFAAQRQDQGREEDARQQRHRVSGHAARFESSDEEQRDYYHDAKEHVERTLC